MTEKPVIARDGFASLLAFPQSKKARAAFVAFVVALVCGVLRKLGIEIPYEIVWGGLAPLCLYILGQGLADWKKEATRLQADEHQARAEDFKRQLAEQSAKARGLAERLAASETVVDDLRAQLAAKKKPRAKR